MKKFHSLGKKFQRNLKIFSFEMKWYDMLWYICIFFFFVENEIVFSNMEIIKSDNILE